MEEEIPSGTNFVNKVPQKKNKTLSIACAHTSLTICYFSMFQ